MIEKQRNDLKARLLRILAKDRAREVVIEVGKEYIVMPTNPREKRNLGRHCIVLDFAPVSEFHPHNIVAKVRYLDNNRVGKAKLSELVPVEEAKAANRSRSHFA